MRNEHGYFNFDFGGFMLALIIIGIIIGLFLSIGLPWLWELVKPWIHSATA